MVFADLVLEPAHAGLFEGASSETLRLRAQGIANRFDDPLPVFQRHRQQLPLSPAGGNHRRVRVPENAAHSAHPGR